MTIKKVVLFFTFMILLSVCSPAAASDVVKKIVDFEMSLLDSKTTIFHDASIRNDAFLDTRLGVAALRLELFAKALFSPVTISLFFVTAGAIGVYQLGYSLADSIDTKIQMARGEKFREKSKELAQAAQDGNYQKFMRLLTEPEEKLKNAMVKKNPALGNKRYKLSDIQFTPEDLKAALKSLSELDQYFIVNFANYIAHNNNQALKSAIIGAGKNNSLQANYWKIANQLIQRYRQNMVPVSPEIFVLAIENNQPVIAQKLLVQPEEKLKSTPKKIQPFANVSRDDLQKMFNAINEKSKTAGTSKSSYINLLVAFLGKVEIEPNLNALLPIFIEQLSPEALAVLTKINPTLVQKWKKPEPKKADPIKAEPVAPKSTDVAPQKKKKWGIF